MPPERLAAMKHELGLDRPLHERAASFIGSVLRGDLGHTIVSKVPVSSMVAYPLRNSLALAAFVLALAIPISLVLGVASAYWFRRPVDHAISTLTLIGYSIPEFVTATVLVILFAVVYPIFPATITLDSRAPVFELLKVSVLPTIAVVIGSTAYLSRVLRIGMVDALASDYVERLRLTGVPEWRIVFRHALPSAAIPALTAMALYAAALVSGLVVVELVFAIPGVGQELVRGVARREVHIVQAIALACAVIVVGFNLLADIAVMALDPRTRK
jgi:peptide/nickel transport system permease protein